MRTIVAQQLLRYANKLDKQNNPEAADAVTNSVTYNYGNDALERLAAPLKAIYELPQYLSKNYMNIANKAFSRFASDIRHQDSELMEYFNQDVDYDDEPDFDELIETDPALVEQYLLTGWVPSMTSDNYTYAVYKLVLRLLERVGAKDIPNVFLSEDKSFEIQKILKQPGITEKFIQELIKLPHETLIKLMPPRYLADASDDAIEEFTKQKHLGK